MSRPGHLLRRLGGRPRARFGQHFLVSASVAERILDLARVGEHSAVIEVGPGLGALTERMVARGARVVAVELDRDLVAFLAGRFPEVRLVEGDATAVDLVALVEELAGVPAGAERPVAVANLPYNAGTRILLRLVELGPYLDRIVVMVQREVAERLVAPAGDRKRGSLSVYVQARAEVHLRVRVPPGAFYPPPKVDSAVVEVIPYRVAAIGDAEPAAFEAVVRAAFATPRKTVLNTLGAAFGKDRVREVLEAQGIDPRRRPATLEVAEFARLAAELGRP